MTKAKKEYPELKTIKQDINNLKEDAVELAHHVKEHGVYQADALKGRATDAYEELLNEGLSEFQKLEKRVMEKPGQSVAIAFAAGILTSFLMGRR